MWRFMFVTFAFLGWSFYELSGGSDYAPGADSLQARAKADNANPTQVQVATLEIPDDAVADSDIVTRASASLTSLEPAATGRVQVTLASASSDEPVMPNTVRAEPEEIASMASAIESALEEAAELDAAEAEPAVDPYGDPLAGLVTPTEVFSLETYTATASSSFALSDRAQDVRQVSGKVVNMRSGPGTSFDKVSTLTKGTEVQVLYQNGDGWLELMVVETGETGWMADWLVAAAAN